MARSINFESSAFGSGWCECGCNGRSDGGLHNLPLTLKSDSISRFKPLIYTSGLQKLVCHHSSQRGIKTLKNQNKPTKFNRALAWLPADKSNVNVIMPLDGCRTVVV